MMRGTSLRDEGIRLEQGNKKFMLGDYQGAIADCSSAIELNPNIAVAYYSRGLAYLGAGQKDLARKGLMRAAELGHQVPHEALGLCSQVGVEGKDSFDASQ
jgi:Flp pilus assembly protein TadD